MKCPELLEPGRTFIPAQIFLIAVIHIVIARRGGNQGAEFPLIALLRVTDIDYIHLLHREIVNSVDLVIPGQPLKLGCMLKEQGPHEQRFHGAIFAFTPAFLELAKRRFGQLAQFGRSERRILSAEKIEEFLRFYGLFRYRRGRVEIVQVFALRGFALRRRHNDNDQHNKKNEEDDKSDAVIAGSAGTGTAGTGPAESSPPFVVDQKVTRQEGVRRADAEVVDHLFALLRRGSDDNGGNQSPMVPDEHFLSGPELTGLQKYPAGHPDRVFGGCSKHALFRLDLYNRRAGREELLHNGLDCPPFRVDRPHTASCRQLFNGGQARGGLDHRSGGETPASSAFVVYRDAAGKEGVRMIGLEVENRDPLPNPLQRQDALLRQGLPIPGENHIAHLEDVECLEGAVSDIEGMICGGPDGLPFGRENDIFIHGVAEDISDLRPNDLPFRRIGQQWIPRPDRADRLFGAVGLQNQALGQEASLVMNDDVGRNERPAGHHQQIISC